LASMSVAACFLSLAESGHVSRSKIWGLSEKNGCSLQEQNMMDMGIWLF